MNFLDQIVLENIYEPTFTEEAVRQQIEDVQACIAYLIVDWTSANEELSKKIDKRLTNLYEYNAYLQRELEVYYVPQE